MPRQGAHTMRVPPGFKKKTLSILVMGLTGAGKSTFISVITGNENIPIGVAGDLDGGTQLHVFNLLLFLKLTLPSVTEEV